MIEDYVREYIQSLERQLHFSRLTTISCCVVIVVASAQDGAWWASAAFVGIGGTNAWLGHRAWRREGGVTR